MFTINKKEDKFYDMLCQYAKLVNESAKVLVETLDCLPKRDDQLKKVSILEDNVDALMRTLTKDLNEAFITPIDREDIYEIVKEMHTILDLITSIMHRFIMFDITESTEEIKTVCKLLLNSTEDINSIMNELKINGCKSNNIIDTTMKISSIESEADKVFRKTVAILFKEEKDPITIMKWKEIYQITEDTIDNCEKVANIIEGVVIKNA